MNVLKPWHILVLVAVLILLFGAKRLPGAARSLGRSLRIIKAETKGLVDEPEPDDLEEKAEAQSGRQPLSRDSTDSKNSKDSKDSKDGRDGDRAAATGEVIDPAERVRDK